MRGEQESRCLAWVRDYLYGSKTGFFWRDWRKVAAIFERAKPNPETSKFPDFVFEDGFIEHFQITASKENKKALVINKRKQSFIEKWTVSRRICVRSWKNLRFQSKIQ